MDRSISSRARVRTALSLLSLAPRLLVPAGSLLAALAGAVSCVPETRFEEAQSAADVQSEALRRAALALEAERERVRALTAELRARDEKLDATDKHLEDAKLERTAIEKQRDDSASLVEQLRGELARAGDHLSVFSQQKTELERQLAKVRVPSAALDPLLVTLERDLGVAIGAAKLENSVTVSTRDGALVVGVRADALFEGDSAELGPLAPAAFDRAARVLVREPRLVVAVHETELDAALPAELGNERRGRIDAALKARGIGDRARFSSSRASAGAPRVYELVLSAEPEKATAEPETPRPE